MIVATSGLQTRLQNSWYWATAGWRLAAVNNSRFVEAGFSNDMKGASKTPPVAQHGAPTRSWPAKMLEVGLLLLRFLPPNLKRDHRTALGLEFERHPKQGSSSCY